MHVAAGGLVHGGGWPEAGRHLHHGGQHPQARGVLQERNGVDSSLQLSPAPPAPGAQHGCGSGTAVATIATMTPFMAAFEQLAADHHV